MINSMNTDKYMHIKNNTYAHTHRRPSLAHTRDEQGMTHCLVNSVKICKQIHPVLVNSKPLEREKKTFSSFNNCSPNEF